MNNKVKVLQVVFGMHYGGTEAFILNTWNYIDKDNFSFDYLYFTKQECPRDYELLSNRSIIYRVVEPKFLNQINFTYQIFKVINKNKIGIIHSHVNELNSLVCFAAYLAGAKVRISHMHFPFDYYNLGFIKKLYRQFQVKFIELFSTNILYCSKPTFDTYNFKAKIFSKSKLLNNTIDIKKFSDESFDLNKIRSEFAIPNGYKVIANISRFDKSKNQKFIVEVFKEMLQIDDKLILLLGGDGILKSEIESFVTLNHLNDNVKFIGIRSDVEKILKITDLYLFPSIEEGFGIVVLECQAANVKIICSTGVPKSTDVSLGLVHYLDLNLGKKYWADFSYKYLKTAKYKNTENIILDKFENAGYGAFNQTKIIEKIYLNEKK
ncbi:hypothetical protein BXU11_04915 [Flavobacterium sp. LM5]|uniref:glycosyltransferase n=1 Tax=Flavobacterium sp. LM5 TaxID=1938610 RepID=UPI00099230D8|nr:glycosyltransferase [Flavobacterium sp. LM5]OOV29263.1 hypothetical protein BXU11_04915 [Flavobacterium sp. LM5]